MKAGEHFEESHTVQDSKLEKMVSLVTKQKMYSNVLKFNFFFF